MSPVLLVLVAAIESLPAKIAAALSAELLRLAGIPAPRYGYHDSHTTQHIDMLSSACPCIYRT